MNILRARLSEKDNLFIYIVCLIGLVFQALLVLNISNNFNYYIPRIMPDDSFYYFKIAENISSGYGSVFSIGEPTNGYHPLWMALLVLTHVVFKPSQQAFVLSSLVLSVVLNSVSAIILYWLLLEFGFSRGQSWVGAICFLCSPWIVNLTFTGLETPLYFTCLLAFLLVVQRMLNDDDRVSGRKSAILLGATAGMLMLARTDAIFFTIPLFLVLLVKKRLQIVWSLLVAGMIATIMIMPWLAWNIQQFQSIEQTSSVAMSALNRYSTPSMLSVDYWLLACTFMLWVAYSTLVPLFYNHLPDATTLQYSYISIFAAACLLAATLYKRSRKALIIIPETLLIPALLLVIYYFFIRMFVQIWHMSSLHILVVILLINYIPQSRQIHKKYAVMLALVLSIATLYSVQNGYFQSQNDIIEQSEAYGGDSAKQLVVCASDAGYLGYFSRHTVVNIDGIVNNRAKDYILLGRFSDYIKLVGCDQVMVEPQRLKYYDRNMAQANFGR